MILGADGPPSADRMEALRADPTLARTIDFAARSQRAVRFQPGTDNLELAGTSPVDGRVNRALMKVFRAGDNLWAAFFYKRSQIPSSRDRYAYGVVEFPPEGPSEADAEAWFRWLDAGFHPELHPPRLKRAFSYTVPER